MATTIAHCSEEAAANVALTLLTMSTGGGLGIVGYERSTVLPSVQYCRQYSIVVSTVLLSIFFDDLVMPQLISYETHRLRARWQRDDAFTAGSNSQKLP